VGCGLKQAADYPLDDHIKGAFTLVRARVRVPVDGFQ